jgi:protein TonB
MFRALLASLGLHILVLLQGGLLPAPERAIHALAVTLRAATAIQAMKPRTAQARDAGLARPSSGPIVSAPDSATRIFAPPEAAPTYVEPGAGLRSGPSTAAVAAATPTVPTLPASEGLDGNALRAFRVALAGELRRFKRYPPTALEGGWSGIAEVRLGVGADGSTQAPELIKSSGYSALDEQALEMVRQAGPRSVVPGPLRGHAFTLSLPIEFELNAP